MKQFKNVLNQVQESLKVGNNLFPDQIHLVDHRGQGIPETDDRLLITDSLANYAIIYPVGMDEKIERSKVVRTNLIVWKRYSLISDCSGCDRDILLEFCLQRLSVVPGTKPLFMSTDSERIYHEEMGEEPRRATNMIRITFDASSPLTISKTKICLDLCSDPPC